MSWASENPEVYSEIVNKALTRKLLKIKQYHAASEEDVMEVVENLEMGNNAERLVYEVLTSWGHDAIMAGEADYWGRQSDAAMERQKYK